MQLLTWKFGKWNFIRVTGSISSSKKILVKCDCGNKSEVYFRHLVNGKSNGCMSCANKLRRRRHGMHNTPIYKVWQSMLDRCRNPNSTAYAWYGGRGISVCDEWYDFINFYKDMGHRPTGKELDRVDNDKGYSKENCHWITHKQNCENRREYPEKRDFFPRKHSEITLSDEVGKKYGKWIVLEIVHSQYDHIKASCRCECGAEKIITLRTLKKGTSTQCLNCGTKQAGAFRAKYKLEDFKVGDRYGKWTVIDGHELRHRLLHIKCRCDCGQEKFVSTRSITQGRSLRCVACSNRKKLQGI